MTDIAFHFGAPDKVAYSCRLLRKILRANHRAVVVVDPAEINRLDSELWSFSAPDFVAHCFEDADITMLNASPVLLCSSENLTAHHVNRDILVNLSDSVPAVFKSYAKLIEVVSQDEDDRAKARMRWKKYTSLGFKLLKHDLQLKGMH